MKTTAKKSRSKETPTSASKIQAAFTTRHPLIQPKQIPNQAPAVTPNIESSVDSIKGGGQPLPESTRAFFETRFGHDFSNVRVHTGAKAEESAQAVNAQAFTLGQDIVFANGEYSPHTSPGLKLIAHELAHTLQQGASFMPATPLWIARRPGSPPEVKTGWIDGIWTYVAYMREKKIRVARHVSSTNQDIRIGTIPWITNNPGNLTVDAAGIKSKSIAAQEPFKRGAYKTQFKAEPTAKRRYAIFPTFYKGLKAIFPVLMQINKGNGGKLTMKRALEIYYKGKGPVDPSYVRDIRKFMIEALYSELPSLTPEQARKMADRILSQKVSTFASLAADPADTDYVFVRHGLIKKEGAYAPPGIEYHCEGGFQANDRGLYTKSQWQAMEAFKSSKESQLRRILECV